MCLASRKTVIHVVRDKSVCSILMNNPFYVHILVMNKLFLFNLNGNVLNIYKTLECRINMQT